MNWDLDLSNYSKPEILDLFRLNANDSNEVMIQGLTESVSNVVLDKSKSQSEREAFRDFALKAGQMLGLSTAQLQTEMDNVTTFGAKNRLFSRQNAVDEVGSHMIISNPVHVSGFLDSHDGRETVEARNPPGIINPIKVHTINRAINIDSRFRDNYYNSQSGSFSVTLPVRITNCVQMRLGNLAIPLTFYTFSRKQSNSTMVITLNQTSGAGTRHVVTIPNGNYSTPFRNIVGSENIEDVINNSLREAGIDPETQLCYRVDRATGRSAFAVPVPGGTGVNSFEVQFACDSDGTIVQDDNLQLRLGWILGFRSGSYLGGAGSGTGGAAIISEGLCFTKGPRYIFLAVDDFQSSGVNDYFYSAFQSSLFPSNVLTRIDIGTLRDSYGFFQLADAESFTTQVNTTRSYFGPITIEKLKLTLYDEFGRVLDLNNMDWSVTLAFECLYQ